MIKKIILFFSLTLCINTVYAKTVYYPVDTVALDAALQQITHVGSNKAEEVLMNESAIEETQVELSMYFIQNKNKQLSFDDIVQKCKQIVKNDFSCAKFIRTYNLYIYDANSCFKANKMEVKASNYAIGGWQRYSYKECYNIINGTSIDENGSHDVENKCELLVQTVQACVTYLRNLYAQKNKKHKYDCVLNNLNEGNFELPLTQEKLEQECDENYKLIKAETDWEILNSI